MSVVYSYCVLPAGHHPPSALRGLGGGPVLGHDIGRFTVWTSTEQAPPTPDLERVTKHHQVVTAAATAATPLPLRFGTWTPDHAALAARIDHISEALDAALVATSGRIEMGIRVQDESRVPPHAPEERPSDGRGYMQALSRAHALRKSRRAGQDELVARIADCLGPLGASPMVTYLEPPGFVALAHLIPRDEEDRYRRAVAGLGLARLHVTGPWPPYSFAHV